MTDTFENKLVAQAKRHARREWLKIAAENAGKADAQKTEKMATFYRRCAMNAFDKAAARGALLCC